MHALLAKDGARYVFPHTGHGGMFLHVDAIVECHKEMDDALKRMLA